MARLFDHIGSTAHYAPSEFRPSASLCLLPTKTHKNHLLDVYIIWFSRPQTTASSLPLQSKVAPQHSASPSNQKPPQHSSIV